MGINHYPRQKEAFLTKVESSTNQWVQINAYVSVREHDKLAKNKLTKQTKNTKGSHLRAYEVSLVIVFGLGLQYQAEYPHCGAVSCSIRKYLVALITDMLLLYQ